MIHGIHLAEFCESQGGAGAHITASENQDFSTERHEWYMSTLELNSELLTELVLAENPSLSSCGS